MTVRRISFAGSIDAADAGRREVAGLLVPYETVGNTSAGPTRIAAGAFDLEGLDPSTVVLNAEHEAGRPLGRAVALELDEARNGIAATFRLAATTAGSDALVEAAEGLRAGLSVEADVVEGDVVDGVLEVRRAVLTGAALVTRPAFDVAGVDSVAASDPAPAPPAEDTTTPEENPQMTTAPEAPAPAVEASAPADVAVVPVRAGRAVTTPRLPSVGAYLYAALHASDAPEAWQRVQAAAGDTVTTDVGGIIPTSIVGELISTRAADRPIVEAFGPLAGPSGGSSFTRPKITDPILDAATAAELASVLDTMKVDDVDVAYSFVKRAFRLSAESIAYTSPAILDAAARDLARAYARGTEKAAGTALVAQATHAPAAIDLGNGAADLIDAAAVVYAAVGVLPDTLVMAPDVWASLAGTNAADGRPLFPFRGSTNTPGENGGGVRAFDLSVLGLRDVVSWSLAAGKAFLVASDFVETYEAHRTTMRAENAGTLGLEVGTGGSIALTVLDVGGALPLTVTAAAPLAAPKASK